MISIRQQQCVFCRRKFTVTQPAGGKDAVKCGWCGSNGLVSYFEPEDHLKEDFYDKEEPDFGV